ncbi:MAG: iron-containing alcohol dehydrogenase [Syntrophorhabdaceae bacterium]|nr:iron-containing alcohol dehydrogenase [Syntrophorhabdaceae bacterium]
MKKGFRFSLSTRIVFGCNALEGVSDEIKNMGISKILIVTDENFSCLPTFKDMVDKISKAGVAVEIFNRLKYEPDTEIAEEGASFVRGAGCDGVLGIGGGSSIDFAKILALTATNEGPVEGYMGLNKVKNPPLPLIAVPTTAGSGSEVTRVAVLSNHRKKVKGGIVSPYLTPRVAILDPCLLSTLPKKIIAETGIDALAHAVESYYSINHNPISDILAMESIRRIFKSIKNLYNDAGDLLAAEDMMLASTLSGAAFLNTGLGNVHSLAQALGIFYLVPHAVTVAILLPYVMEENLTVCGERFVEIATVIGLDTEGLTSIEAGLKVIDEVKNLLHDIGIPKRLSEIGVTDRFFREVVADAMQAPMYLSNPKQSSMEELIALCERAL